jgi:hypothetical protein
VQSWAHEPRQDRKIATVVKLGCAAGHRSLASLRFQISDLRFEMKDDPHQTKKATAIGVAFVI